MSDDILTNFGDCPSIVFVVQLITRMCLNGLKTKTRFEKGGKNGMMEHHQNTDEDDFDEGSILSEYRIMKTIYDEDGKRQFSRQLLLKECSKVLADLKFVTNDIKNIHKIVDSITKRNSRKSQIKETAQLMQKSVKVLQNSIVHNSKKRDDLEMTTRLEFAKEKDVVTDIAEKCKSERQYITEAALVRETERKRLINFEEQLINNKKDRTEKESHLEKDVHETMMRYLDSQLLKLEELKARWVEKSKKDSKKIDQDILQYQTCIENHEITYSSMEKEVIALKEYIKEDAEIRHAKRVEEENKNRMILNVIKIQAWWKSMLKRKFENSKQKMMTNMNNNAPRFELRRNSSSVKSAEAVSRGSSSGKSSLRNSTILNNSSNAVVNKRR